MNPELQQLLSQLSAEPINNLSNNMLCDLSNLGIVKVTGEDAENFLQGQLTNDLSLVTKTHSQMSAYCTHKGRIQANFRICRFNDDFLMQMPKDILPSFVKRIAMFVMRAKVKFTDVSDDLSRIGFAGPHSGHMLGERFPDLPMMSGDVYSETDLCLLRLPGDMLRFELICSADKALELIKTMDDKPQKISSKSWQLLDIRAGIPSVIQDTFENFVPQMINMHLIDGISFTKGCYIGQEVVARLKYLGKTKRQMYLAKTDSTSSVKPGDKLYSVGSSSGQGAGNIVNIQPSPNGGYEMLVVSEIAGVERDDVQLHDAQGAKITFMSLPYSFEN